MNRDKKRCRAVTSSPFLLLRAKTVILGRTLRPRITTMCVKDKLVKIKEKCI